MLISDLHDAADAVQWCNECRAHKDGHCDGCGREFLRGESWYRSQTFHYHPAAIEGKAGVRAVNKQLCVECYREDHKKAYPEAPVPDLPDRGVDPKFHAAQRTEHARQKIAAVLDTLPDSEDKTLLRRMSELGLRFG